MIVTLPSAILIGQPVPDDAAPGSGDDSGPASCLGTGCCLDLIQARDDAAAEDVGSFQPHLGDDVAEFAGIRAGCEWKKGMKEAPFC